MLRRLHIQNYAIIDKIEIEFSEKLNIITGETGAGKSILMGALSLILGDRSDSSVLQDRQKKCFIEGTFSYPSQKKIREFLKDHDLDPEDELVIRREIAVNGKSRAFINDTPVNLEQLRRLSHMLVDLHQQFDTLELSDSGFQRDVIDALAAHSAALNKYRAVYSKLQSSRTELTALQQQKDQFNKELDYNKFLFDELAEANFQADELETADQDLKMLSNSEGIKSALSKVSYELQEGEQPMVQHLKSLVNQLHPFTDFHAALPDILKRLQSMQIELQDIADDVERVNDRVQYDPKKIDQLSERIATGYKLLKKHGVKTTAELLAIKGELEKKLDAVLNIDELIKAQEILLKDLTAQAQELADEISTNRKKQIKPFETKVNGLLQQVGMPNARLKVSITDAATMGESGKDNIDFLFDANKSNRFEPVGKVASGGELSRLMLCIKSLVAKSLDLPTMIFDEIDSGISGEAAKQVGIIMKELAGKRQVISITHQPQIAGKADAHFFVYKQIKGDAIKTNIRLLTTEERITAIAQMLGGEKPTAAAIENAREMMN